MEERPNQCYFLSPPKLTEEASEKECGKRRGTWNTLKGNRVSWPSQGTEQEASCPTGIPGRYCWVWGLPSRKNASRESLKLALFANEKRLAHSHSDLAADPSHWQVQGSALGNLHSE